jgi:hypothetical protein
MIAKALVYSMTVLKCIYGRIVASKIYVVVLDNKPAKQYQ